MIAHPILQASKPVPNTASPSPLLERLRLAASARGDGKSTADTLVIAQLHGNCLKFQ